MKLNQIDDERCCGNCRFYFEDGRECRRYPPTVWSEGQSETSCSYCCSFPSMRKEEWCGEFQPIEGWVLPKGWELKSMPDGPGGLCEVQDNS